MRAVGDPLLGAGDAAVGGTRVRIALASEPEPASVSANAPISSPEASAGTYGEPWASSGSVHALVCTATVTPTPASARESSSSTST